MTQIRALFIWSLLLSVLALPRALSAEYTLMPSPETVHVGNFDAARKPVLTINSGDTVTIESSIRPSSMRRASFLQAPCRNTPAPSVGKSPTAAPGRTF